MYMVAVVTLIVTIIIEIATVVVLIIEHLVLNPCITLVVVEEPQGLEGKEKGPWDKMEKEEQYMKLIQLKRIATKAEEELKLMKTKVARLERQAKEKR